MENDIFSKIKENSKNYTLEPPERVWNKLAFTLEKNEFKRKENSFRKIFAISTIAALFIIFFLVSNMVSNNTKEMTIMEKSELIIEDFNNENFKTYNVHNLINQLDNNKKLKDFENSNMLKVNKS
ncbi:MAG: hypothetical protein R2771_07590 [Saprospiraceae bacterium]